MHCNLPSDQTPNLIDQLKLAPFFYVCNNVDEVSLNSDADLDKPEVALHCCLKMRLQCFFSRIRISRGAGFKDIEMLL